jgi:hypothetical protein
VRKCHELETERSAILAAVAESGTEGMSVVLRHVTGPRFAPRVETIDSAPSGCSSVAAAPA